MCCRRWLASSLVAVAVMFSSLQSTKADLVISFTNETWSSTSSNLFAGFTDFTPTFAPDGLVGTLTGISVNATLDDSVNDVFANDLTVLIVPGTTPTTNGLLQVGGFTNLGAEQRQFWANGNADAPGTTVIDTVTLGPPITFTGTIADPTIWIGNGYLDVGRIGTWSGSITLHGISAVPEPSAMVLTCLAVPAIAFVRRRRKKQ